MATPSLRRDLTLAIHKRRRLLRACAIGLIVVMILGVLKPSARRGQAVLVAARDLPAGLALEAPDLAAKVIPADLLPLGAIHPGAAILGRTITSAARKGEVITDARILSPGLLAGSGGLVVAPVRLADPGSVALLRAGDRVDVLSATGTDQTTTVTTIASSALVLAVPTRRANGPDVAAGDLGITSSSLIVLAVRPKTAALLAKAAVASRLSVIVVG